MCIFYLIDAYKAKKVNNIPAAIREAVGFTKESITAMKGVLFPKHFAVKDAVDAINELARRLGIGLDLGT